MLDTGGGPRLGCGDLLRYSHKWNVCQPEFVGCCLGSFSDLTNQIPISRRSGDLVFKLCLLCGRERRAQPEVKSVQSLVATKPFFETLNHESPFHLYEKECSYVLLKEPLITVVQTRTQKHACCQSLVEIFVLEIFLNISNTL